MSSIPHLPHTFNCLLLDLGNFEARISTSPEAEVGDGNQEHQWSGSSQGRAVRVRPIWSLVLAALMPWCGRRSFRRRLFDSRGRL